MVKQPKILMADDEINILALSGEALKQQGYDVITASNGIMALEKAVAEKPDLVILDRQMPGMNGLEVCKNIRETAGLRDVPVIFLTGQDSKPEIMQGYSEGANEYITKPFNLNELIETVANLLSNDKKTAG
ncbi:MAG: response regulator [Candidatus Margulisiibacteriota bacterium]